MCPKLSAYVRISYLSNHFIGLVNLNYNKEKITNILEYNHAYPEKFPFRFECVNIKDPMWIEVIHGRNVDNDCKMTLDQKIMCSNDLLLNKFNVHKELSPLKSKIGMFILLPPYLLGNFYIAFIIKFRKVNNYSI